jgi:hypothetical protein
MSLLPAAMKLPDDIPPLGKKVVPPAPPKAPDPTKVFEELHHPYPNGTYPKPPLGPKPFFGFDFGDGDNVSMVTFEPGAFKEFFDVGHRAMTDAMMLQLSPYKIFEPPVVVKEKTATEIMMKQRAATERNMAPGPKRQLTFDDLDAAVTRAVERSGLAERTVVRMVENLFGGTVKADQMGYAIEYVNTIVDDCPF